MWAGSGSQSAFLAFANSIANLGRSGRELWETEGRLFEGICRVCPWLFGCDQMGGIANVVLLHARWIRFAFEIAMLHQRTYEC